MTKLEQLVAYQANANAIAFKVLVEALVANGALRDGQIQDELRATIVGMNEPARPDLLMLSDLLEVLEEAFPKSH